MPVAGVIAAGAAGLRSAGAAQVVAAAISGVAVVFGAWAVTRELAPDDNPAAFVSMSLAFAIFFVVNSLSVLLLFATLFLVRIVNRSVGLPARILDSLLVVAMTILVVYTTRSPLLGLVGALAFLFDSAMHNTLRRQLPFAALCLTGTGVFVAQNGLGVGDQGTLASLHVWQVGIVGVAYAVTILQTRRVESLGDVTGNVLSVSRVRAGMLIGLLIPLQALMLGTTGFETAALIWATLAGVVVSRFGRVHF